MKKQETKNPKRYWTDFFVELRPFGMIISSKLWFAPSTIFGVNCGVSVFDVGVTVAVAVSVNHIPSCPRIFLGKNRPDGGCLKELFLSWVESIKDWEVQNMEFTSFI